MTTVKLQRIKNDGKTTIGNLIINDLFACFVLEDGPNEKKVYGETRIPAGKYKITLRTEGTFHENYSKRFPEFHHGMLWIREIPEFEYVLIHCGNTNADTKGCLLVGTAVLNDDTISGSTAAYKKIYPVIAKALLAGEEVYIEITDEV